VSINTGNYQNALLFERLVRVVMKGHFTKTLPSWIRDARSRVQAKSDADAGHTQPSVLFDDERGPDGEPDGERH
jgi:hypothetical protein